VIVTQHSASIAGSNAGYDILEWHNRWAAISFSERQNQHWPNQASKKDWDHSHVYGRQKLLH